MPRGANNFDLNYNWLFLPRFSHFLQSNKQKWFYTYWVATEKNNKYNI